MRVALIHDHLIQKGGGERVLEALSSLWPYAPIFTLAMSREDFPEFASKDVRTSFIERLPGGRRHFRWYLPFMPTAIEHFDLRPFDVAISCTSALAKGIVTHPHTVHISYCHTPTRYLWSGNQRYVDELDVPQAIKKILPPFLTFLRMWDRISADRVDHFVANSENVRRRIKKYYGKDSEVIHPPVDVEKFHVSDEEKTYYLAGGRLVAYKRFDLIVEAFKKLGKPLKIFGTGPAEAELRHMASPNIEFVGRVSDDERARLFAGAVAFIYPQEEDFGITAVESMAAGRPVIAYKKGGAIETVIEGVTGTFFDEQSSEELMDTILHFDHKAFSPAKIRAHAETFSTKVFREKMLRVARDAYRAHARDVLGER